MLPARAKQAQAGAARTLRGRRLRQLLAQPGGVVAGGGLAEDVAEERAQLGHAHARQRSRILPSAADPRHGAAALGRHCAWRGGVSARDTTAGLRWREKGRERRRSANAISLPRAQAPRGRPGGPVGRAPRCTHRLLARAPQPAPPHAARAAPQSGAARGRKSPNGSASLRLSPQQGPCPERAAHQHARCGRRGRDRGRGGRGAARWRDARWPPHAARRTRARSDRRASISCSARCSSRARRRAAAASTLLRAPGRRVSAPGGGQPRTNRGARCGTWRGAPSGSARTDGAAACGRHPSRGAACTERPIAARRGARRGEASTHLASVGAPPAPPRYAGDCETPRRASVAPSPRRRRARRARAPQSAAPGRPSGVRAPRGSAGCARRAPAHSRSASATTAASWRALHPPATRPAPPARRSEACQLCLPERGAWAAERTRERPPRRGELYAARSRPRFNATRRERRMLGAPLLRQSKQQASALARSRWRAATSRSAHTRTLPAL